MGRGAQRIRGGAQPVGAAAARGLLARLLTDQACAGPTCPLSPPTRHCRVWPAAALAPVSRRGGSACRKNGLAIDIPPRQSVAAALKAAAAAAAAANSQPATAPQREFDAYFGDGSASPSSVDSVDELITAASEALARAEDQRMRQSSLAYAYDLEKKEEYVLPDGTALSFPTRARSTSDGDAAAESESYVLPDGTMVLFPARTRAASAAAAAAAAENEEAYVLPDGTALTFPACTRTASDGDAAAAAEGKEDSPSSATSTTEYMLPDGTKVRFRTAGFSRARAATYSSEPKKRLRRRPRVLPPSLAQRMRAARLVVFGSSRWRRQRPGRGSVRTAQRLLRRALGNAGGARRLSGPGTGGAVGWQARTRALRRRRAAARATSLLQAALGM